MRHLTVETVEFDRVVRERAWSAVRAAVKNGILTRPTRCTKCGRTSVQIDAHHADYWQPLAVQWLCLSCHRAAHAAIRRTFRARLSKAGRA